MTSRKPGFPALNYALGETIDMLREMVRDFAMDQITPRADTVDLTNEFPRDLWPKHGGLGLLGITVSEEYGNKVPQKSLPRRPST